MVVATHNCSKDICEKLRANGYDVVTFGRYNYPIDALLYTGESIPTLSASTGVFDAGREAGGIFVVNCENKSINELDNILRNRVYTPLF